MATDKSNPLPQLTEADVDRFWSKVDRTPGQGPNGECWEWTASRNKGGYGQMMMSDNRPHLSNRLAYRISRGEDVAPLFALHTCDNRPCCNPDHIYRGNKKQNSNDMMGRNRGKGQLMSDGVRGESNTNAKFTEYDVMEIRRAYAAKEMNQYELAARYNVTRPAIGYIVRRRNWSHVE